MKSKKQPFFVYHKYSGTTKWFIIRIIFINSIFDTRQYFSSRNIIVTSSMQYLHVGCVWKFIACQIKIQIAVYLPYNRKPKIISSVWNKTNYTLANKRIHTYTGQIDSLICCSSSSSAFFPNKCIWVARKFQWNFNSEYTRIHTNKSIVRRTKKIHRKQPEPREWEIHQWLAFVLSAPVRTQHWFA